jgi:hypothetical protein
MDRENYTPTNETRFDAFDEVDGMVRVPYDKLGIGGVADSLYEITINSVGETTEFTYTKLWANPNSQITFTDTALEDNFTDKIFFPSNYIPISLTIEGSVWFAIDIDIEGGINSLELSSTTGKTEKILFLKIF